MSDQAKLLRRLAQLEKVVEGKRIEKMLFADMSYDRVVIILLLDDGEALRITAISPEVERYKATVRRANITETVSG